MDHRHARFAALAVAVAAAVVAGGQGRGNPTEWPTAQADAQRTSWIRNDVSISPETMSKGGFELQWKTTLDAPVRHGVSLGPGVITSGVNIFTPLSTIAAPSNRVFAIDNDTGNLFWTRRFEGALAAGTAECPGGISGSLTRMVNLTTPEPGPGRGGGGRGRGSYSSAVGDPGAGVPIPSRGGGGRGAAAPPPATPPATGAPAPAPPPPPPAPVTSSAIPPGQWRTSPFPTNPAAQGSWTGLFRPSGVVYAVSADGMFRTLGVVSGKDLQRPAPFLPPGARFSDLIAVGDLLYTSTSHGCGGAADGVWAIDISGDRKVASWKTNGGRPLGSVAFTASGIAIVAVGPGPVTAGGYSNAVVALDPKTLAVKDWYTQPGVEIVAPPVVFQEAGKDIVVVTTKDGRVLLLDAAALGGANHATPLFASASLTGGAATFAAQSPAMWRERTAVPAGAAGTAAAPSAGPSPEGARWLVIPVTGALPASLGAAENGTVSRGALLGVKLAHQDGKFSVQPAWVSQDIASPLTPIVVNGVAFAASAPPNAPAALYALHGTTGTTLWQSGKVIASPLSGRSFWVGSGHVFAGTRDGTLYAFGFAMERK
jgi:hypothetical protein